MGDPDEFAEFVNSQTVVIGDSPPSLQNVTIPTDGPYTTSDDIPCIPGETLDSDGDTDFVYAYKWFVNGAELPYIPFLLPLPPTPSDTDSPTLAYSIWGYRGNGADVETNSSLVLYNDTDADSDNFLNDTSYNASVYNQTYSPTSAPTIFLPDLYDNSSFLPPQYTLRGYEVSCSVIPGSLGTEITFGKETTSNTITIANSPPVVEEVMIVPSEPSALDNLTCIVVSTTDADGDRNFTYEYAWRLDGFLLNETDLFNETNLYNETNSDWLNSTYHVKGLPLNLVAKSVSCLTYGIYSRLCKHP